MLFFDFCHLNVESTEPFNMSTIKNRRKYLILSFSYKLIINKIDCPPLIENLNFKIKYSITRNKDTFLIMSYTIIYCTLQSLVNSLMSVCNSVDIDIFNYNLNDIKTVRNF